MSMWRAYALTLDAPGGRGVFYLPRFVELRALLEHFRSQWCARSADEKCSHDPGVRLVVDRVWLEDGFVSDRPTEFAAVPEQLVNACPGSLLGVL